MVATSLLALGLTTPGLGAAEYSPHVRSEHATRVYWGDTHLHTGLSADAAAAGNRLGLDEAYRFARGELVTATSGLKARLSRPLDFLVASDHSDGMGFFNMLAAGDPLIMAEPLGVRWHELLKSGEGHVAGREIINAFSQGTLPWKTNDPELMAPVWKQVVDAAERHNTPGAFTAFIGYEWTSLVKGNNLHRVVIRRDGAERAGAVLPYTLGDSADPEDLWAYMARYQQQTGGRVLAIPHNGNLSNGMMFADVTLAGEAYDSDYLRRRQQWEPLVEVTQIKGDGETHPLLSPEDEFADYETWDAGNLDFSQAKTDDMLRYEYAREALKRGLDYQARHGINPFEFGLIGSSDSHTSLAAVEEDNFFGKMTSKEPGPKRAQGYFNKTDQGAIYNWQQVSSGYAAVWARENTREALWDAMSRREVYGTTGSRITVRLFGGWGFTLADSHAPDLAAVGYAKGVPMGAELGAPAGTGSPSFLVAAQRDPIGANLDRIQIVKGWRDSDAQLREKVYDVAWSGERKPGPHGRLPPLGSTVDVAGASWTNTVGAPQLVTVWRDPDFDPAQAAFYYVRVLEIPTPRWTAYDASRLGVKMPEGAAMTTRERAYTSPIWYKPPKT
jgi:hypothetical protein